MNITEIRDSCIKSAETYLKYMDNNNKGYEEIEVTEISSAGGFDSVYKLRLGKKLFDLEAISIKCLKNNIIYSTEKIKVVEYDSDSNLLFVRPESNLVSLFSSLVASDIKIISDLKFLVKNVKEWYELNGANVRLPTDITFLSDKAEDIDFIADLVPSETQKESLKSIFTNPFTYVWGAPGTGKTQFVLAYSALHYIRNDKKIVIMAPTNNALEQVLRGVIKMTDKAGIKRKNILRLGNPTKKFAEEYPEVCEERGIQKALKETNEKIDKIERVLTFLENVNIIKEIDEKISKLDEIVQLQSQKDIIKLKLKEEDIKLRHLDVDINEGYKNLKLNEIEVNKLIKKKNSIIHKIIKAVTSTDPNLDDLIITINEKVKATKKEIVTFEHEKESIQQEINDKNQILNELDNKIKSIAKEVKKFIEKYNKNSLSTKIMSPESGESEREHFQKLLSAVKDKYLIDKEIHEEYKHIPKEDIQKTIDDAKKEKDKLLASSPDARLASAKITACTLDGYIGRFRDKKLNADHFFLDEAGYANIVKALTLFHNDKPITFLGDHMQLPPVCEINDADIQRDPEYANMYLWAQSSLYLESVFSKTDGQLRLQYLKNETPEFSKMKKTSLISTFRFGSNLAKILDRQVYNIGLVSANSDSVTKIISAHAVKSEGFKSRESINEVNVIKDIIREQNPNDFIILTPYKKQVRLLGRYMPFERNNLKILTVHGSQGREWETVILSVVDTGDKWFVDSVNTSSRGLNLLNTAVSRAKKELIIVCDTGYWRNQNGQLVSDLLSESISLN